MGSIIFEVKGATANFKLEHDEITSYEFAYSVPDSKYAKSSKDSRELVIKGSIPRTLTRSEAAMKEIREWAKEKYKDPSFYSFAKITVMYRDEIVREITFPNAFIKNYNEEINPQSGDGIYTITLLQKIDKRVKVIVDPFNVEHPTLSEKMAHLKKQNMITYDANGGEGQAPPPQPFQAGRSVTIAALERPRKLFKINHTFDGWCTDPYGTGTLYPQRHKATFDSDITLYAKFTSVF